MLEHVDQRFAGGQGQSARDHGRERAGVRSQANIESFEQRGPGEGRQGLGEVDRPVVSGLVRLRQQPYVALELDSQRPWIGRL